MKYIGAFLVACAAHNILVVSSSGADLLQESYKQPEKVSSEPDEPSEIHNADALSRETIIKRQTHTNVPSSDHTSNETPSYVNAPYTYNHPSQGHQENKLFSHNLGASQPFNPSYNQIPHTNGQFNSPTIILSHNGIQSHSSTPFNTLILTVTPYNSQYHNNAPFNALIINISPYNIPNRITPYNNLPFDNNPYNVPAFGHNPFNKSPFGHNPFNKSPFGHNPFNKSPFGHNPFNKSRFGNNPHEDPPNLKELSNALNKKNCSRQLRISEIKCRTYSECTVVDCDDPPPPFPGGVASTAGGVDAKKDEFPHAAAIGWKLANRTDYSWSCGGSLISERFVLTAAHCAKSRDSSFVRDEPEIVRLGELDFADGDGDIQDISIAEFIKHPDYKWPSKYNDIALIRLEKRAVFGDSVLPTCLWGKDTIPDYTDPTAIGWGALYQDGEKAEKLQKVYLDVVKQEECEETYGRRFLKRGIVPEQLCAGDLKMDTCRGDSGGPLTIEPYRFGCRFIAHQIGITSFGQACGMGVPGVYTRVSAYLDWIEGHVWPVNT